jgi:6-phosphogluconolactonase
MLKDVIALAGVAIACLSLTACGGGGSSPPPPPPPPAATFTIGGTVSGLTGSGLVLALNGAGNLTVNASGAFTFSGALASGTAYTVTVVTQPSAPNQVCAIAGGTGSVAAANVTSVSVTCVITGRFAYVANNGLNNIDSVSAYSINRMTGLLTPVTGSPFAAGHTPISLAIRPDSKFLYVVNPVGMPQNGALSVFSINETTGVLTQVANSPFATSTAMFQIAIEPSGKFAFTPNFTSPTVSVFSLDPTMGAPTPIGGSPFPCVGTPVSIAVAPNGQLLYVGTQGGGPSNSGAICAYSINSTTGALTPITGSPFPAGGGVVRELTVDPTVKFVYAALGGVGLGAYSIGAAGGLTPMAGSPFASGANADTVAVDPAGKFAYVGNDSLGASSQIFVFSIDATTGTPTQVGTPIPSGDTPAFITIDPSGDLAYVANLNASTITVYAVNKTTGALTATGSAIPNGTDTFPSAIAILR